MPEAESIGSPLDVTVNMGDSSAVKVAIRVRPFNDRERQEGAVLCVDIQRNMTRLMNKADGSKRDFFFDYCYWSHDEFETDPQTGYMTPTPGGRYADQQRVFADMGVGVLDNAWNGYHTCLFAYGQTGSGKSYSMVGYGSNKGIIPMVCEEIFQRMSQASGPGVKFEVKVSMLEIYNERVQDLLQPTGNRTKDGLKVRESPGIGVFVEGISKMTVSSYDEIRAALEMGNTHRTIAATQMNATSSRAHTVLTISFTQTFLDATGQPLNRKQSDINLVDLAGSERASKTGATGDRLTEGSNINLSLSTLGRVITALAKKGSGESGKDTVPYRESKLTRILQNALGGNSKTAMIAAISPAVFNYDETLSTLRYADQVKSIKNVAIVNETQQERLIRELREENEKLKAMLGGGGPGRPEQVAQDSYKQEYEQIIEKLKREKEIAERGLPTRTGMTEPHLSNLNEDPLLSGNIKHGFKEGRNVVGRRNDQSPPDIVVEGLGVQAGHCIVQRQGDVYTLIPSESAKTMVNGKLVTEPVKLAHGDRIRFGNHNYFSFTDPEDIEKTADWETAVREANSEGVDLLLGGSSVELQRKEEEMKQQLAREKELMEKQFREEREKLEAELQSKAQQGQAAQKQLAQKEADLLARQRIMEEEMERKEKALRLSDESRQANERLRRILTACAHKVNEANERASLLGKEVKFTPELFEDNTAGRAPGRGFQNTRVRVRVLYEGLSPDLQIHWDLDKLDERLVDMQELTQQQALGDEFVDQEIDPFVDDLEDIAVSCEPHLIGTAYVYLETIFYLLTVEPAFVNLIDDKGRRQGTIKVEVQPKVPGKSLEEYDNLKEFAGATLQLTVKIEEAASLPPEWCSSVRCLYSLPMISQEEYSTDTIKTGTPNPKFNYSRTHELLVTYDAAEEVMSHALTVKVYGDLDEEVKRQELQKIVGRKQRKTITPIPAEAPAILEDPRNMPRFAVPDNSEETAALRRQLEERDRLIEQLKRDQLRKEQEYNLTLRKYQELERRGEARPSGRAEQTRGNSEETKRSKACVIS